MKRLLHLLTNCIAVGTMLVVLFVGWPHSIIEVEGAYPDVVMTRPLVAALPLASPVEQSSMGKSGLNLAFNLTARMPAGSLGLPGEPVTWVITLVNTSDATGTDVIITDKLRDELQIDSVDVSRGEVAISDQMIVYTLPEISPDETAIVTIHTTVRHGPLNGLLHNQAALVVSGPYGTVSRTASTEVFVPSGLPATGYAPVPDKPGHPALPLSVLIVIAASAISTTAFYVYMRGRRV